MREAKARIFKRADQAKAQTNKKGSRARREEADQDALQRGFFTQQGRCDLRFFTSPSGLLQDEGNALGVGQDVPEKDFRLSEGGRGRK